MKIFKNLCINPFNERNHKKIGTYNISQKRYLENYIQIKKNLNFFYLFGCLPFKEKHWFRKLFSAGFIRLTLLALELF